MRDYDMEDILGVCVEETPQTLAYELSADFTAQVMRELDRLDIPLKELAERMGVKQPTLCGMLRDDSNMTFKTVARMACALGCDVEPPRLVGRSERSKPAFGVVRGGRHPENAPLDADRKEM